MDGTVRVPRYVVLGPKRAQQQVVNNAVILVDLRMLWTMTVRRWPNEHLRQYDSSYKVSPCSRAMCMPAGSVRGTRRVYDIMTHCSVLIAC